LAPALKRNLLQNINPRQGQLLGNYKEYKKAEQAQERHVNAFAMENI